MNRRQQLGLYLLLLVIGLIFYYPSTRGYFVSDDWHWLYLASRSGWWPSWLSNYEGTTSGGSYAPLAALWFNSWYRLIGLNSWAWHSASVAVHALNAWLVAYFYLQWSKCFPVLKRTSVKVAMAAAFLFLLWPTLSEAVSWVAAVPHLLASCFYLLTLILYLRFLDQGKKSFFFLSLVTASAALFIKEISVTLPATLVVLEIAVVGGKIFYRRGTYMRWLSFTVVAVLLIALRFAATGAILGNYAQTSLRFNLLLWWHNLLTFAEEFLTVGLGRWWWMAIYWRFWVIISLSLAAIALAYLSYCWSRKLYHLLWLLALLVISLLPYVPLGFNRMSSEGERYTYLPAIFFIMLLLMSLERWLTRPRLIVAIYVLVAFSAFTVSLKNQHWLMAGAVSRQITDSFPEAVKQNPADTQYVAVGLPDNISGAQVFRNNLQQALDMRYGQGRYDTIQLPVYLQLTSDNYRRQVVRWRSDERGFFADSVDREPVVTGIDRVDSDRLIFELWHYDYDRFSSDTIRLILKPDFMSDMQLGRQAIITWDQGRLRLLKYPLPVD